MINKLINKGSRVYIEGRIQTRSFDDKTGNRRHVVEILADNMLRLDNRKDKEGEDLDDFDHDSTAHSDLINKDDYHSSSDKSNDDFVF